MCHRNFKNPVTTFVVPLAYVTAVFIAIVYLVRICFSVYGEGHYILSSQLLHLFQSPLHSGLIYARDLSMTEITYI